MTCGCEKEKPKGAGKNFTKAVVEINNPSKITLLRKVVIPASLGDETTMPPVVGKYCNVVLYYEASKAVYLYSSDGIPTLLTSDISEIERQIENLQTDLAQEVEDREDADADLDDKIDKVADDLGDEVSNRIDAVEDLQGQIDDHAENTRRTKPQQFHQHHSQTGNAAGAHVIGLQKQRKAQGKHRAACNRSHDPAIFMPQLPHGRTPPVL